MSFYNESGHGALRKRKTLKKGIQFTIMIVGQSGSGRSTFINTLCGQDIVETSSTINNPNANSTTNSGEIETFNKILQLRHENVELEDDEGLKISLNIIDTPGFADSINCEQDFNVIVDYIRHQYDEILLEESRVKRNPRFKDGRIHTLLYLINATGHGLKEIDIFFLKKLNKLVNIIPIISKADSLTIEELQLNKNLIMKDLEFYGIDYYKFNYDYDEYNDEELIEYNKYLNSLLPFSIIGANDFKKLPNGEIVKIRKLRHGEILIDDEATNDFSILKNVLLVTHLNEFKETTHEILYEKYRTEALSGKEFDNSINNNSNKDKDIDGIDIEGSGSSIQTPGSNENVENSTYLLREEQIKLEEERLKKFEERVQNDLILKRKELLQREKELKEIEMRLEMEQLKLKDTQ